MRIAMLCPHYGIIERGTENTTRQISKRLKHKVDIFSVGYKGDIIINSLRKDKGLGKISNMLFDNSMLGGFFRKYIGFNPNIEDITFTLKTQGMLESLIDSYDLLWSNGEYWCADLVTYLGKKYKKPTVLFFGGGKSQMMLEEAKMLPSLFVVLTPEMETWVKKKVPECNVKCIPCGADLKMFKPIKKIDGIEHPIVISTAALVKGKRIELIIDAMEKLGKGNLYVTSDGPLRHKIMVYGYKKLRTRFHYLGKVDYDTLPGYYSMADFMVLASKNEPFGMTIIESMACNTPVIVQSDKTRRWMVGEGGIRLKDITDIDSLARAIDMGTKLDWKNKPREQAINFDWDNIAKQYEKSIKEIVNEKTS